MPVSWRSGLPAVPTEDPRRLRPRRLRRRRWGGEFRSGYFDQTLTVHPGVFPPDEAEALFLPLLSDHDELLEGARVLDIGADTGVIGLFALSRGAASVIATDVDERAIQNVIENARRLGFEDRIEARLVPADDMSAYSTIAEDEAFDLILSNPPYSLDLNADQASPLIDTGELGLSIIHGLEHHLSADGVALLLYNSLFYHEVIVKIAGHLGLDVRHHAAPGITSWELESLFNLYLRRILEREELTESGLTFDDRDAIPFAATINPPRNPPLLDRDTGRQYPGFVAVRHR